MKKVGKKKIKILGAGLSGLTAAINLANVGYDVEVYEKNKNVGQRFHGDLQGLENWSKKEDILEEMKNMGIKTTFDYTPFSEIDVTNAIENKKIIFKRPLFYLVKRGSMLDSIDTALKKQAIKAGVKIYFNKTLPKNKVDIVATGPLPNGVLFAINKGIVFDVNRKNIASILMNNNYAYKGYSYLLITKKYGCLCTVVIDKTEKMKKCFEDTRKFYAKKYNLDIKFPKNVGGFGNFSLLCRFKRNGALYVGEAAGLQDILWGYGMRFAIESGYLAAQSIINKKNYFRLAKKEFMSRLRASVVNRYLWEKCSGSNYSFVIKHLDWMFRHLYSLHNFNLMQKILYPFALKYLKKEFPDIKFAD